MSALAAWLVRRRLAQIGDRIEVIDRSTRDAYSYEARYEDGESMHEVARAALNPEQGDG